MQADDIIWQVLNNQFCSFKIKTKIETFCKNEYNMTGLCTRTSCPLANSRYATVLEKEGVLYLYMKTIERAHLPAKMWERVKLDKNYEKALAQIDQQLIYWPSYIIHRCKQRLTRITQMLIRMRRLRKRPKKKLVSIKPKEERVQRIREKDSLVAAKLEKAIEKELLDRLTKGDYAEEKGALNVHPDTFKKAIKQLEPVSEDEDEDGEFEDEEEEEEKEEEEEEEEEDEEDEEEEEEEEEEEGDNKVELVEDEFVEDASDIEDLADEEYEYEVEMEKEKYQPRQKEKVKQTQKAMPPPPSRGAKRSAKHLDIRFDGDD